MWIPPAAGLRQPVCPEEFFVTQPNNICALGPSNTLIFKLELGAHHLPLRVPLPAEASLVPGREALAMPGPHVQKGTSARGFPCAPLPCTGGRAAVSRTADASLAHLPGEMSSRAASGFGTGVTGVREETLRSSSF